MRTAKTVVLKGRVCGNKGRRSGRRLLRRGRHHGSRRPRSRTEATRHVHRVHRTQRPAPPGVGGRGQLGRRGHGRACHADRRDPAGRRRVPGGRRRRRASRSGPYPEEPQGLDGGDRDDHAARRRQVRREGLPGLRRPARRRHLGGQRPLHPADPRGRPGRPALGGRVREGRKDQAEDRAPSGPSPNDRSTGEPRTGTTVTFWPDGSASSTRPSSGPRPSPSACRSWPS